VTLEVSKRVGTNIIEVIEQVKATVEQEKSGWSSGLQVSYSQDKSQQIRSMLKDLQNNVMAAVLLVMIVMVAALGLRPAGMIGISIPGSFLTGLLVISLLGLTMNMVVLFALIMAVGMLVDGTIVVVELADRKMAEGLPPREAYAVASKRMAMPIVAATATTLAAFLPLLFWPGIVGEFMKYLPITLIATLSASLVMALIFVPTLGAIVGRRAYSSPAQLRNLTAAETGILEDISGPTRLYMNFLRFALRAPGAVVVFAVTVLIVAYLLYANHGRGVEFFPQVEPERAILNISTRGDLSIYERDALLQEVEARIAGMKEFKDVYARSTTEVRDEVGEDVIGSIHIEFVDWRERRPGRSILDEVRARTADLAGLVIEVREEDRGPNQGKAIQIQLSSRFPELLPTAIARLRAKMESMPGLVDVTDSRPVPGIEWQVQVDRAEASRFGADIITVGNAVQLVTNGVKVGEYRPHDADEEVDIRVRYPTDDRSTGELDRLRVPSAEGAVPISNFVKRVALPRVGTIKRSDTRRVLTVEADTAEGVLPNDMVNELRTWIAESPPHESIEVAFKGEDEDQREAQAFLIKAFLVALFVMAIILVAQFNSFYQAFLILSAVIFSTIGVLIGLLVIDEPFGIVMSGVGVISLAGIVVNNNIVLIDTFNQLHGRGMGVYEAILRTGVLRLRPVLLTTTTTILGLMPMVLGMNVDLIGREVTSGGPSTQWWTQLATAVAGGLTFATLLTLIVTPAMLLIGTRDKGSQPEAAEPTLEPAISH
jgi:multidrug efflux pump